MSTSERLVVGLTASGVAGAGWVGLRLYIRNRVYLALVEEYDYPGLVAKMQQIATPLGIDLNMPPAEAFSESLAPIWSLTTPYDAIEDVLAKGRSSIYWPVNYRKTPKGGEDVERIIFVALSAAYHTPEGASKKEMSSAAAKAAVKEMGKLVTKLDVNKLIDVAQTFVK